MIEGLEYAFVTQVQVTSLTAIKVWYSGYDNDCNNGPVKVCYSEESIFQRCFIQDIIFLNS